MKRTLLLFILFWTIKCVGQTPNYEQQAVSYFQSDTALRNKLEHQCDCREKFDKSFPILFFDSVYLDISLGMAFDKLKVTPPYNSENIDIFIDSSDKIPFTETGNIKRAKNSRDFITGHYLVRFSHRIHIGDEVIVEMLVKSKASCSGINYYFYLGLEGNIIRAIPMIWCDSQG